MRPASGTAAGRDVPPLIAARSDSAWARSVSDVFIIARKRAASSLSHVVHGCPSETRGRPYTSTSPRAPVPVGITAFAIGATEYSLGAAMSAATSVVDITRTRAHPP